MKTYEELSFDEKMEIKALFTIWLKEYSHDVVLKVMEKREEIINNEFSMKMLRELAVRESKEKADFQNSIDMLFRDFEQFKQYDVHNNPLTHANSYRDILRDLYIA